MSRKKKEVIGELSHKYVEQELNEANKALQNTQIWGSVAVFGLMCYLFSIAGGFASNLQPKEAAKITKGLIVQRLDSAQEQVESYLGKEIPTMIESVPDYAKSQLPIYRESIENTLEGELAKLADDTSSNLDKSLDTFLIQNQDEFKTIILSGQDKETTDKVAGQMKDMFLSYLTEPTEDGESIQDKLDQSLKALHEVEVKTAHLANGSNLTAQEQKQRRAIACLFKTVQDHKGELNIPKKEDVQAVVKTAMYGE